MPSSSSSASSPWTEDEQRRLEDGLLKCAATCDLKEKWKAIAAIVETRDARACAERFKACRRQALDERRQETHANEEDAAGETREDGKWWNGNSSNWNSHGSDGWKWDQGWWWQDGNRDDGWQQESWNESHEEAPPTDEAERRRWEIQKEIEDNRKRLQQREEQKQKESQAKEAKLKAERDQKEKERMDKLQERQDKLREVQEREEKQRKEAEQRQRELQRQQDKEDTSAGFFGQKYLGAKASGKTTGGCGKGPVGWAGKAATSKGQLQKQRKQEEMERQAREVLANIGSSKAKQSKEQDDEQEEDDEELEESQSDNVRADEQLEAKAIAPSAVTADKRSENNKGAGKKGSKKGKSRRPAWWANIDGDCPISLVPINELPKPPFALNAEGSSVPHYFDARFLASFLLSSCDFINPVNRCPLSREDCVALDKHLQDNYRDERHASVADAFDLFELHGRSGSDSVRREATAVLQHLFSFRSARDLDTRGRAINYNDGGLTVIDDDDIQVSAAQHAVASNAAELGVTGGPSGMDSAFPSLGGSGATANQGKSWAGKGAKNSSNNQAEAYPSLPSSRQGRGRGNDPGRGGTAKSAAKPKGRGAGAPPKQACLHKQPKGWGSPT